MSSIGTACTVTGAVIGAVLIGAVLRSAMIGASLLRVLVSMCHGLVMHEDTADWRKVGSHAFMRHTERTIANPSGAENRIDRNERPAASQNTCGRIHGNEVLINVRVSEYSRMPSESAAGESNCLLCRSAMRRAAAAHQSKSRLHRPAP